MKKKKVIVFLYNRLNDPLIQANIFLYINELTKDTSSPYQFCIITFEDKNFAISEEEKKKIKEEFMKRQILWEPLKWHMGDNLAMKAFDLFLAFLKVLKFRILGYRHAITLGSIAGSFIYLISRLVPIHYYLYQYEPHSEYLADSDVWAKESKQFRYLNKLEKYSVLSCRVVSSGTHYMQQRLNEWGIKKPFYKVTSVANDSVFKFSAQAREKTRSQLKISDDQKLIIYPGKIGGIYANAAQLIAVFKELASLDSRNRFLIITSYSNEIEEVLRSESAEFRNLIIVLPPVEWKSMPDYLSAADMGVVSVLPGPSQRFRSNIKVGEYLCAGLPYLICKGVSEDDLVAEKGSVGVVVEDLKPEYIKLAKDKLVNIFSVPKKEMAERCRKAGIDYRGFDAQFAQFKEALNCLTSS